MAGNTKPKCFVIMPYGGSSEETQRHYLGVYHSIIRPAAEEAGYEVHRSDLTGPAGNITLSIIRDLVECDMVIADLTGGNANVMYEVGVRHVLRKSGTVHIIDKRASNIPFDIAQYRAVQYSTDFADIETTKQKIREAIEASRRLRATGGSDNLVHDAIPSLPQDVRSTGDAALRAQIDTLQARLNEVEAERKRFRDRLEVVDPSSLAGNSDEEFNVDSILAEAEEARTSTGQGVQLRLAKAAQSGGADAFVDELKEVLKRSRFLTRADFMLIQRMCNQLGLESYTRAALEVARKMYPDSADIMIALADEYQKATDPTLRARGRVMVEKSLGVEHENGLPVVAKRPMGSVESAAITLFNYYMGDNRFDWVETFAASLEKHMGATSLYVRNRARALHKLGRSAEAEAEFQRALELNPRDDTAHAFYADFLDDERRYEESYVEFEYAILSDPADGNRFINLANHINLRGVLRHGDGSFYGPISREERKMAILPLYVRSLQNTYRNNRQQVVNLLVNAQMMREAQMVSEGREAELDLSAYNVVPLGLVEDMIERKTTPPPAHPARPSLN